MLVFQEVESIEPTGSVFIERAAIPGGWLILIYDLRWIQKGDRPEYERIAVGTTFIPDIGHLWNGSSLNPEERIEELNNPNRVVITEPGDSGTF